jgi:hypothetical protein
VRLSGKRAPWQMNSSPSESCVCPRQLDTHAKNALIESNGPCKLRFCSRKYDLQQRQPCMLVFVVYSCRYYRGRGAFESMGAGLPMAPGDIAFKSNFATYNNDTGG